MFRDDSYGAAFKAAAKDARARIRRDRAKAPNALKKVFSYVASHLFDPPLTAARAWAAAGVKDRAPLFKSFTGTTLWLYIIAERIEAADLMMETTDLDLASISERLGYTHYLTFEKHYEALKGKKPSEVTRKHLPPPMIDAETSLKAARGDENALVRQVEGLFRFCPAAAARIHGTDGGAADPLNIVDGAGADRWQAEELWRKIRDLPFADQCRRVRGHLFYSTVLFDLLLEQSRLLGRRSRQRGVALARLALVSLEASDQVFGKRIHELRALGWAWLGNALGLALELSEAMAAFEKADREWSEPRRHRDLLVLVLILRLRGVLRTLRREYTQAGQDLDRCCSLCQQLGEARDEALALIQRATNSIYSGKLGEAVEDLREASGLIDEDEETELAFAIRANLANALALAGKSENAAKELNRARQLNRTIDDPLGSPKLDWIEGLIGENCGDLEKAKSFYQAARAGFHGAKERRYYALVSVDLMIIHAMQEDWQRVGTLAAKTLPILGSLKLYPETVAAVDLLAKAVEARSLSRRILDDLRAALRQDPLTNP